MKAPADGLRSTPKAWRQRDPVLFPALDARRRAIGTPTYYWLEVGPRLARIYLDAFFVPEDLARRLEATYHAYLREWLARDNPMRRAWPRGGVTLSGFRDFVMLLVLRRDAREWISALEACAPYTFNPWRADDAAIVAAERWAARTPPRVEDEPVLPGSPPSAPEGGK